MNYSLGGKWSEACVGGRGLILYFLPKGMCKGSRRWSQSLFFFPCLDRDAHWGWWDTGTACLKKWWMPHPWKHPCPGGRGWATWSSWRCFCSFQEDGPGDLQRSLPILTTLGFLENLTGWHWRNKAKRTTQKQPVHHHNLLQREELSNSSHTLLLHPYEFFHNLI